METTNTKIYLVRHAMSEANDTKKYTGWLDVDLTAEGISQAKKGRDYFAGIDVDSVYSSPLTRAYKTARIIFGDDAAIIKTDEFKELNVGLFETKTYAELLVEYPEEISAWVEDPTSVTPPRGEDIHHFYKRVSAGLTRVISENIGETAVIVAHGGVIRCIALYALGMRLNDIWRIKVDNLSVSIIEFMGNKRAVTLLNDTCHL